MSAKPLGKPLAAMKSSCHYVKLVSFPIDFHECLPRPARGPARRRRHARWRGRIRGSSAVQGRTAFWTWEAARRPLRQAADAAAPRSLHLREGKDGLDGVDAQD